MLLWDIDLDTLDLGDSKDGVAGRLILPCVRLLVVGDPLLGDLDMAVLLLLLLPCLDARRLTGDTRAA